jgi:hypothetical protein
MRASRKEPIMTAVQTLREPKAERFDSLVSQSQIEVDEPETPLEQYRRWCRESNERQQREGPFDEEPLTMEEIVAIIKEVRAEMYEEGQKIANSC